MSGVIRGEQAAKPSAVPESPAPTPPGKQALQAHYVSTHILDPTPTPSLDRLVLGDKVGAYWQAKQRLHDSIRQVQAQRVAQPKETANELPGKRLGASFEGLPRDFGQGIPAGARRNANGVYVDEFGKPLAHQPAAPVPNEHVMDPTGLLPFFQSVAAFAKHPGFRTAGLGALSAAGVFIPGLREAEPFEGGIARAAARRVFKVNDLKVEVPASRARTGRLVERAVDAVRNQERAAGGAYRLQHESQMRFGEVYARTLAKAGRHLSPSQEYALRVAAEGTPPAQRIALHTAQMATSDPEHALYHQMHADMVGRASKYIDVTPEGKAVISENAPEKLKKTWALFQKTGEQRQALYKQLSKLTDERIAERIHAPGRVFAGARFRYYDSLIRQKLEESPVRQAYFRAVDQFVKDPAKAQAEKTLFDARIRKAADDIHGDPTAVDKVLDQFRDVLPHEGEIPPELKPGASDVLHQEAPRANEEQLPAQADENRTKLEAGSLALRSVPGLGVEDAAKMVGVEPADLKAFHESEGQSVYDRVHSNADVGAGPAETPQSAADIINDSPLLAQRGGSLDEASAYGIKGATQFEGDQATIHLFQNADETTFPHELAHVIRRLQLQPQQESRIAKFFGATMTNKAERAAARKAGAEMPRPKYAWNDAAEEKFARSLESFIRSGQMPEGPAGRAIASLAPVFREAYAQADLPDLPPHVASFFKKLFEYNTPKGGRLLGAEDVLLGSEYAPVWRGIPISRDRPLKAMATFIRHNVTSAQKAVQGRGFFSAGRGRVIGAGSQDAALVNAYKGSSILDGFFRFDVVGPKVQSAMVANKLGGAFIAREAMLQGARDLPSTPFDYAIREDLSPEGLAKERALNVSDKVRHVFDKMATLQEGKIDAADLHGIDFQLINEARDLVFPGEIGGRPIQQLAQEKLDEIAAATEGLDPESAAHALSQIERIPNVKWVSKEFLDKTGLLYVPSARRNSALLRLSRVSLNVANDVQKAFVLWLNPAYVPMQLIGNIGMNLLQQGVFMPANAVRTVMMHRELDSLDRISVDSMMGTGAAEALMGQTSGGRVLQATIGHWASVAADLLPRRMSFLHEAYREGVTVRDLPGLLEAARNGDQQAFAKLDAIATRAKDAIVDFDRLSPFEREVMSRIVWFYPWLRGATRYSARFIIDHPVESIALGLAAEYLHAHRKGILGPQPYTTFEDVPISTESLGMKVPFTNLQYGLSNLVGKHTLTQGKDANGKPIPTVFSFRQLLTQATPLEILKTGIGFATGNDQAAASNLVQMLTPIPYAAGVSLFGYDPFTKQQVPSDLATFFGQLGPSGAPIVRDFSKYNQSPQERAKNNEKVIHPTTKWEDLMHFGLGSLAPVGNNRQVAEERVLKSLPTFERRKDELIQYAHDAGFGTPPPSVIAQLKIKVDLQHQLKSGMKPSERLAIIAKTYDTINGGHAAENYAKGVQTEGQAAAVGDLLRARLYPELNLWQRRIDAMHAARLKVQHVSTH